MKLRHTQSTLNFFRSAVFAASVFATAVAFSAAGGIIAPTPAEAISLKKGLKKIGKGVKSVGRGVGRSAKAAGRGVKAAGRGVAQSGKFAAKSVGRVNIKTAVRANIRAATAPTRAAIGAARAATRR